MGWRDLLQKPDETTVSVWVGGRSLRSFDRAWNIEGRLPQEHGWHKFKVEGRKARWEGACDPEPEVLRMLCNGYLVGNRLVADDVAIDPDPRKLAGQTEEVLFLPDGLDRFARIRAGRPFEGGPLVYAAPAFPLGPEEAVLAAYLDEKPSVLDVKGVTPGLDAAFRLETFQRAEAERRRQELERQRREEEERRVAEERRQQLVRQLGDAVGRREMAAIDFDAAARAALAVGGATFLDARRAPKRGEMIVRFRYANRRFECICQQATLRIVDSGICLIDHDTGEKGDTYFTLESLPGVIREAIDQHRLVVFRHAD